MSDLSLHTAELHACVDRLQAGDRAAADQLFSSAGIRLEKLAKRMLAGFPALRNELETSDLLQTAIVRLLRSLKTLRPDSTRSFFNLAAVQMRRELLDLARSPSVRQRAKVASVENEGQERNDNLPSPVETDLDSWVGLHEAVEQLPVDLREVFGLTLYHGWKQAQIAELLQISDRQVRRLMVMACEQLQSALGGRIPKV